MTDPIQQQLIIARKDQILDAAAVMFAEKGFHPTTVRDIARQAGVADGTIYNYFENKTALLLGIFERMRESVIQGASLPDDANVDLHTFTRTLLRHPLIALRADNFALFRVVVSEMMVNEELRARYYEEILKPTLALAETYLQEQAAREGIVIADVSLTIRVISSMVLGLMLETIMGDPVLAAQWDELPDFLSDLFIHGLRSQSS